MGLKVHWNTNLASTNSIAEKSGASTDGTFNVCFKQARIGVALGRRYVRARRLSCAAIDLEIDFQNLVLDIYCTPVYGFNPATRFHAESFFKNKVSMLPPRSVVPPSKRIEIYQRCVPSLLSEL